jgi:hypothetical protein
MSQRTHQHDLNHGRVATTWGGANYLTGMLLRQVSSAFSYRTDARFTAGVSGNGRFRVSLLEKTPVYFKEVHIV